MLQLSHISAMSSFIFLSFFFIFCFTDCHLLSLFLNLGVIVSPYLSCVSSLTQTLEMPLLYEILIVTNTLSPNLLYVSPLIQTLEMSLLYGILIVTDRLQPPQLYFFFLFFFYKFSIVLCLQIDRYGLQCDSFLSVFSILLVMAQVRLPKPNQMSARDR